MAQDGAATRILQCRAVNISPTRGPRHHRGEVYSEPALLPLSYLSSHCAESAHATALSTTAPGDQNNETKHISAALGSRLVVAVANAHRIFTGPAYARSGSGPKIDGDEVQGLVPSSSQSGCNPRHLDSRMAPRRYGLAELWAWMAVQGAHAARRFARSRINLDGETATGRRGDQ